MSDALTLLPVVKPIYPERQDQFPDGWLEEFVERWRGRLQRGLRKRGAAHPNFVARVRAFEDEYQAMDLDGLRLQATDVGRELRSQGLQEEAVSRAFAIICAAAERVLGKRYFDVQLLGAWVMLQGMVAEMETGEGKTLTATLAACTAALAGIPVHVITVNDYLVSRDAETTRPLYEAFGLTVGVVLEDQTPPEHQMAFDCHIVYGTNKMIVFDYLRDRITLASQNDTLRLQLEKLGRQDARAKKLLLRGLVFAIVDEADSVMVDEARTPLIISAPAEIGDQERLSEQAIKVALDLTERVDFILDEPNRRVTLTDAGKESLADVSKELGGIWSGVMRREELIVQALTGLHLFVCDDHYLIRDGKIEIIDEHTGRTMTDRSWDKGMHQLVEAKEGCKITAPKEPLSRISYQRFFRRYLLLSGMTGTASEVGDELGTVYGLAVVKIPTHRPCLRQIMPVRIFVRMDDKWAHIVQRIQQVHESGRPVLLGTRSVAASEHASALLNEAGLPHQLLNAKHDKEEAAIVAMAGELGRITIATNMAGRGTDVKLADGVAELGGLHVILSEHYDSKRIDRQLAGRCARQGDPGSVESILSLEDALVLTLPRHVRLALISVFTLAGTSLGCRLGSVAIRLIQRMVERQHTRIRKDLLKMDQKMGKTLAFAGNYE